jgi:UDP-N-acetylmuramyl pentapeptide phosphotransferase/UDP-N-acetylglucosamine-1-phosphate transferase
MTKYLYILIILIFLSFVYLKLAVKFKIIDKPNQRSSHSNITIRGGGIIFSIAILLFSLFNNFQYHYFTLGVIIISIVSFLDDIYTLSSKIRFPFQFLSVCLVLFEVSTPVNFYLIIFLIIGVGLVNFFNFMDGINGITGLYSISVLLGFYFINGNEHIINADLIIYSLISLIVFGFYNFRSKALFFAGDIGSIAIGLLVFFLGMLFALKLGSPLILLLVIVYGADATLTLLYRKLYTTESIFDPHRHHIYQKLVHVCEISHMKVSSMYALIQIVINFIIYKTYILDLKFQLLIFVCLVMLFMLLYILVFQKIKRMVE